jgi:DNA-binding transcriptional LysR family regulator
LDDLRRLDLNLLVTLDALLAELHVTRAAAKLHLSQPAVSLQLARLRAHFGDPLLLPGPRGMRPTARAEELRGPLREALEGLRRAVAPAAAFDPATATNTWRIDAADYGALAIVAPVVAGLRRIAPHTRLVLVDRGPGAVAQQLASGELDLVLHTRERMSPVWRAQKLFDETYVLAGRRGHPRLKRRPSLAAFCALEHVVVSPEGGGFRGPTDTALEALGLSRRVVLSLPHFTVALATIASTDLVAMLPSRLVRGVADLQVTQAPLAVPGYEMAMGWHERSHRDAGHRWLRQQVAAAMQAPARGARGGLETPS